jgi:ABC-2 type transport system permease protein
MITDILTVIWKEFIEFRRLFYESRAGVIGFLVQIGMFGVFLPVQEKEIWAGSLLTVFFISIFSLVMVMVFIADSFAGERERKTLETLLASRLPDRAILFGKILTAVCVSWGMALLILSIGLVSLNIAQWSKEGLILYTPLVFLSSVVLGFLGALFASSAGVLLSLRASTVRQAQQNLGIGVMILFFIPGLVIPMMPSEWKKILFSFLKGIDPFGALSVAILVFLVADILLILAAMARFKRARLILD